MVIPTPEKGIRQLKIYGQYCFHLEGWLWLSKFNSYYIIKHLMESVGLNKMRIHIPFFMWNDQYSHSVKDDKHKIQKAYLG